MTWLINTAPCLVRITVFLGILFLRPTIAAAALRLTIGFGGIDDLISAVWLLDAAIARTAVIKCVLLRCIILPVLTITVGLRCLKDAPAVR